MTRTSFLRRLVAVVFVTGTILGILTALWYVDSEDDRYVDSVLHQLTLLSPGDSYNTVTSTLSLGPGTEMNVTDIPTIQWFNSTRHRDGSRQVVPVVEGNKIFMWEVIGIEIYISFDAHDKMLDKQVLDSTSL
ncbi:unnamed protein product [Tuwongella immobilis]|uniref:Uncharacterized protein n=1 Tax=Tuwongella immobilis TaxID=692036 RepID=A0A6C2YK05_9BACT|nr:unnamed protein product [Tuwongella immobilis]VTR99812.1 unnamed protein product [Tuwongella immobilis]